MTRAAWRGSTNQMRDMVLRVAIHTPDLRWVPAAFSSVKQLREGFGCWSLGFISGVGHGLTHALDSLPAHSPAGKKHLAVSSHAPPWSSRSFRGLVWALVGAASLNTLNYFQFAYPACFPNLASAGTSLRPKASGPPAPRRIQLSLTTVTGS